MDPTSTAVDSITRVLLSPELLRLVLLHVDPRQRLGPSALVCSTWRAAANAATTSISISIKADQRRATALSSWLKRHSGQVTQLQVAGDGQDLRLDLPCNQLAQLQQLKATEIAVYPIATNHSGSAGPQQQPLGVLAQLTRLRLQHVLWCSGSFQPLSTLTSLRQLHLQHVIHAGAISPAAPGHGAAVTLDAALGSALSHLVQLRSLLLSSCDVTNATLTHISCLWQLQDLALEGVRVKTASLPALPRSLTRLQFEGMDGLFSISTTPALAQLTALQHLQLVGFEGLEPGLLSQMVQLTHLSISYGKLVPAGSSSTGTAALLAAVAGMTLLQHLELYSCLDEPHAPAAAYAALTASSNLTCLRLAHHRLCPVPAGALTANSKLIGWSRGCNTGCPVPTGALTHMFAAWRQLPNLQSLLVACRQQLPQQQLTVANRSLSWQQRFDQLLQCCPGLLDLNLANYKPNNGLEGEPPFIALDGLLALPGLTRLILNDLVVDERGSTNILAQMTGLQELAVYKLHTNTAYEVLLQLTALKQLRQLQVFYVHPRSRWHVLEHVGILNEAPSGSPPDVWQQLQERCIADCKKCARLVLKQFHQAQEQLAESVQQLAEARQELAAQRALHAAQLAQLQQQLRNEGRPA